MNYFIVVLILLLAAWGSFLNCFAYRLVHDLSLSKRRSICPKCQVQLKWYDLIPLFSWLILFGKCRTCQKPISKLYPFIELLTVLLGLAIYYHTNQSHYLANFIFCSSLIITIRTDLSSMLISRLVTIFLIPIAFVLSYFNYLDLSFNQIFWGAFFGYIILFLINQLCLILTQKAGIGEGDFDLLAFIGAFTGIYGAWFSLMLGSIFGAIIGLVLIYHDSHNLKAKIPFGPFLALGAISYILFENQLLAIIFV